MPKRKMPETKMPGVKLPGTRQPAVVAITGARESLTDDMRTRQRRYLWSMGVRTVSFVAAVALLHGWARWVGIALAVGLPWFAVVFANAGRTAGGPAPAGVGRPGQRALTADAVGQRPAPVTVVGAARPTVGVPADEGTTGQSDMPPAAPGADGPVQLTTTRRN